MTLFRVLVGLLLAFLIAVVLLQHRALTRAMADLREYDHNKVLTVELDTARRDLADDRALLVLSRCWEREEALRLSLITTMKRLGLEGTTEAPNPYLQYLVASGLRPESLIEGIGGAPSFTKEQIRRWRRDKRTTRFDAR